MIDLVLLSKQQLEWNIIYSKLKETHKNVEGNSNQIFIGKAPQSVIIYFPSLTYDNPDEIWTDVEIKNFPKDYVYCTHIDFHLLSKVKTIISIINELYPDLYIVYNEEILSLSNFN